MFMEDAFNMIALYYEAQDGYLEIQEPLELIAKLRYTFE